MNGQTAEVVETVEGEVVDNIPAARTAAPSQALATTPAALLAIAVNQGAELDKLERLMALQERWEANEARKAFVAAMADFKAEPMHIGKNKHVSFKTSSGKTEYDHAELSDVTDVVVPRLAKHGFSHGWTVSQTNNAITVACKITHRLGHSETVEMTAPPDASGGKNNIQAIASTKTYLERYTLLAATGLATSGQDDDGRGGPQDGATSDTQQTKADDWIRVANSLQHPQDYNDDRKRMKADYGDDPARIPPSVVKAFNDARVRVMPKD